MLRMLLLCCACLLLAGFSWPRPSASLSGRLVAPGGASPLLQAGRVAQALTQLPHRDGQVVTTAGAPVFWRVIDPGDYRLDYHYRPDGTPRGRMDFMLDFDAPDGVPDAPRGTVLLLHGWMMDGSSLLPWALQLAQAGYRTVSIDLRNHGRSGAAPAGYGTREAGDVVEVVAALRARGEISGPLHMLGVSYGAATAIFSARALGDEVQGVIAMESFENAGHAIRDMVPHMLDSAPETLVQQFTLRLMRWRFDAQALETAISSASDALALPLDGVDVGGALAQVPACVLLIHGDQDRHVPVAHGRALAAAAPRAHYLEVQGEDHISLPMRLDLLGPTVIDWLDSTGHGQIGHGDGDGSVGEPAPYCANPLAIA